MTGVKDTVVHAGTDGKVTRQEGLGFTQFLAVRWARGVPKSRYFNTERAAKAWLAKHLANGMK
jgi:hypothetical protein